jgi:hypothetical protein
MQLTTFTSYSATAVKTHSQVANHANQHISNGIFNQFKAMHNFLTRRIEAGAASPAIIFLRR